MGKQGKHGISWTDETWNPATGCMKISDGCRNCYAERYSRRGIGDFVGRRSKLSGNSISDYSRPFGEIRLHSDRLRVPYHWRRSRRVFVCSMGDLFHADVPDGYIMLVFKTMAENPDHIFQILTKRSHRMMDFFLRWSNTEGEDFSTAKLVRGPEETRKAHPSPRGQLFADMLEAMGTPPDGYSYPTFDWMEGMMFWPETFSNIWIGVTVENQDMAHHRIPDLMRTPAAVRYISVEPMLSPIALHTITVPGVGYYDLTYAMGPGLFDYHQKRIEDAHLDWVICGGESGPEARPMDPAWVYYLRDQCVKAGIPFHFKQWGEWAPSWGEVRNSKTCRVKLGDSIVSRVGRKKAGHLIDGEEWLQFPAVVGGIL